MQHHKRTRSVASAATAGPNHLSDLSYPGSGKPETTVVFSVAFSSLTSVSVVGYPLGAEGSSVVVGSANVSVKLSVAKSMVLPVVL